MVFVFVNCFVIGNFFFKIWYDVFKDGFLCIVFKGFDKVFIVQLGFEVNELVFKVVFMFYCCKECGEGVDWIVYEILFCIENFKFGFFEFVVLSFVNFFYGCGFGFLLIM